MQVTFTLSGGLSSEEGSIKVANLGQQPFTIGRSPDADWTLIDESCRVSGLHLELRAEGGALVLVDRSSGGTALGSPQARLQRGQPTTLPPGGTRLFLPVGEIAVSVEPPRAAGPSARPAPRGVDDDPFGRPAAAAQSASGPFHGAPASAAPRPGGLSLRPDRPSAAPAGFSAQPSGPGGPAAPPRGLSGSGAARADQPRGGAARDAAPGDDWLSQEPDPFPAAPAADPFPAAPASDPFPAAPAAAPADDDDPFGPAPAPAARGWPPSGAPTERADPSPPASLDEGPSGADATGAAPASPPGREARAPQSASPLRDAPLGAEPPARAGGPADAAPLATPPRGATQVHPAAPRPGPAPEALEAEAALAALFDAMGLDIDEVPHGKRVARAREAGVVLVAMADALRQLLESRRTVKRELGVAGTEIEFGANPLKFAPDAQAAADGLLRPLTSGYLSGEAAVADALKSLISHQMALVGGIKTAMKVALESFDPETLEKTLERRGLSQVVPALRKAELWDRFVEDYARVAEQADDDIRALIGRELNKLYAPGGQGGGAQPGGRRSGREGGQP